MDNQLNDLRKKLNSKIHKKSQRRLSKSQMTNNTIQMINSNKYDYTTIVDMYENKQRENQIKRQALMKQGHSRVINKQKQKTEVETKIMAEQVSNEINQDKLLHDLEQLNLIV